MFKIHKFLLIVLGGSILVQTALGSELDQMAKQLIKANGEMQINALNSALNASAKGMQFPDDYKLRAEKTLQVITSHMNSDEFIASLVPVYTAVYTRSELEAQIKFYTSTEGLSIMQKIGQSNYFFSDQECECCCPSREKAYEPKGKAQQIFQIIRISHSGIKQGLKNWVKSLGLREAVEISPDYENQLIDQSSLAVTKFYEKVFSEAEKDAYIAFYNSAEGQSILQKSDQTTLALANLWTERFAKVVGTAIHLVSRVLTL